jgi:hypothetical protein
VLAINSLGEVAGTRTISEELHAFVWLPRENPNYPDEALQKGFNDLNDITEIGSVGSSANDINDTGQAAGTLGNDA